LKNDKTIVAYRFGQYMDLLINLISLYMIKSVNTI
jgi:hypothetical protein